ncbi:MAG: hypothetical protein JJT77_07645 [Crocinitomicaceae bacterium]|nr:hypothetical protein [Crocinitomicaceae bacterium]
MKEELKGPEVTSISVAVVAEKNELNQTIYNVYVINEYDVTIRGVLVSSKGYGKHPDSEEIIKTSMLRHFLDDIPSKSFKKVEPIIEDVFGLNNEYWVSFWINNVMHDKKFIFLPEVIQPSNFVQVPILEKKGVLISS